VQNRGRLTETKRDGDAERVTFGYDSPGGVTVTDATSRVTRLNFGLGGQLAQVRDGAGRIVEFGYDGQFQFTSLTGPGGERYRYSYDNRGNLTGIRDALNLETGFDYEANFNRLASFTDARENGIDYEYDARGNLVGIVYADDSRETFTHDARGNVLTATNRRGQTITYTYNAAGLVTTKDYATTPGVVDFTYQYDAAGNLTEAAGGNGTTRMTYEPATDRLTRIDYPGGQWFEFTYTPTGQRKKRTDQDGHVTNYNYDAAGRLDTMTDGSLSLIVDYDYDTAGRLSRKTLGNGVYTTYEYDSAGNVLHLINYQPGGAILSRYDYTYDVSGRRTSMTTLAGTFEYGYDALGQLIAVLHPDGRLVSYDYDAAGNRRQVNDNGAVTTYTTNDLNQYVTVGNATYEFDLDGNLIRKTENGDTTTYTYDIENRLIGVATPLDSWVYSYDPFGNRIAGTHNGEVTQFIVDPFGLGNVAAELDGTGNVMARYEHGFGLLSRVDQVGDSAFYTFQAIGHTSELTDVGGAVLNSYAYDPWGITLSESETVSNPFEFVGEFGVMNEGNGLEFMRARFYNAADGGFLQPDPLLVPGMNLYSYSEGEPTTWSDPTGLVRWGQLGIGVIQILGNGTAIGIAIASAPWTAGASVIPVFGFGYGVGTGVNNFVNSFQDFDRSDSYTGGVLGDLATNFTDSKELQAIAGLLDMWAGIRFGFRDKWLSKLGEWITEFPDFLDNLRSIINSWNTIAEALGWPLFDIQRFVSGILRSFDPNDKLAPAGVGDNGYVVAEENFAYTIRFENQREATGPAREIIVTDLLNSDFDLSTFELTEIAFANRRYAFRRDCRPTKH
jgi:RHS repeat-associated protein